MKTYVRGLEDVRADIIHAETTLQTTRKYFETFGEHAMPLKIGEGLKQAAGYRIRAKQRLYQHSNKRMLIHLAPWTGEMAELEKEISQILTDAEALIADIIPIHGDILK